MEKELEIRKFDFPFFTWLSFYISKIGINDVYNTPQINVQTNLYKNGN